MVTTLSSKGQVVLPRSARARLHLSPGTKFECQIEGESIVLTPARKGRVTSRLMRDKSTGLMVTAVPSVVGKVTSRDVRNALIDFP